MALEIMQMWAQIAGGAENGLATMDIPSNGILWGVDWAAGVNMDADSEAFYAELSFIATHQAVTNDVRGIISAVRASMSLTTSGVGLVQVNKYVALATGLKVTGGERLFINSNSSAGITGDVNIYLHFDPTTTTTRRSSRRR